MSAAAKGPAWRKPTMLSELQYRMEVPVPKSALEPSPEQLIVASFHKYCPHPEKKELKFLCQVEAGL